MTKLEYSLTTSTAKPVTYFAGQSPTPYTRAWGLAPFDTDYWFGWQGGTAAVFGGASPASRVLVSVNEGTSLQDARVYEVALTRRMSQFLVELLPAHAVQELLEHLYDLGRFYMSPTKAEWTMASHETKPAAVQDVQHAAMTFIED